jgi:hypothetical protein
MGYSLVDKMRNIAWFVIGLGIGASIASSMAQNTVMDMNYKGQPVPSAIAPSMSAFSQDVCGIPVSGAISSTVIGVSGGTVYTDANCERIKIAKTLNDLGLKVAAVATLCADNRVWDAMLMSGTPCPIDGLIGDAARDAWIKKNPEKFEKLYGKVPPLSTVATKPTEDK